jgi:uncharacterized protein
MRWDRSHASSNVEDRRSAGGGFAGAGGVPIGAVLAIGSRFGWKGILIALAVVGALMYGGGSLCTGLGGDPAPAVSTQGQAPEEDELAKFVGFVFDDAQAMWARDVPGYRTAKLVLFRGGIRSGCGGATAAVGPFYCPLDHKVYIDLSFYDELRRRFGAPGDFAQAYVIAHEVGHHVQALRGTLDGNGSGDGRAQIAIELQADCLAGAWARNAAARKLLEPGDADEALNAAAQIGDDALQRRSGGRVQPETWTHGSSAQRTAAFKRGLDDGAGACTRLSAGT